MFNVYRLLYESKFNWKNNKEDHHLIKHRSMNAFVIFLAGLIGK